MSETMRLAYFSRFLPTADKGGGCRRTSQIMEVCHGNPPAFFAAAARDGLSTEQQERIADPATAEERSARWLEPVSWSAARESAVVRLRCIAAEWAASLPIAPPWDLVLVEDPVYFYPLLDSLAEGTIPVVALCQNLETLSLNNIRRESQTTMLKRELDILARCAAVVTISREEDLLLRNLGMKTYYLPYYPVPSLEARFRAVRLARSTTKKSGYLIMGSSGNIETKIGMAAVARHWSEEIAPRTGEPLFVCGYLANHHLADLAGLAGVEYLGELGNAPFDQLLSEVRAVICYQEAGAGSLTRIPESLLAGLPVLANPIAARSHQGMEGVVEFASLAELWPALERGAAAAPRETVRPSAASFHDFLRSLTRKD